MWCIWSNYCVYLSCIYLSTSTCLGLLNHHTSWAFSSASRWASSWTHRLRSPKCWSTWEFQHLIWAHTDVLRPKSPAFEHQCYHVDQQTLVEARPNLSKMTRISVSLGKINPRPNPTGAEKRPETSCSCCSSSPADDSQMTTKNMNCSGTMKHTEGCMTIACCHAAW